MDEHINQKGFAFTPTKRMQLVMFFKPLHQCRIIPRLSILICWKCLKKIRKNLMLLEVNLIWMMVDRHCEWLGNTMCGNTTGSEQHDERCSSWSFHQKVCLLIKSTVTQDLIENCNSNICSYTLYADNIIQRFKNDSFWVFLNVFYFRGAYPPDGG